jgi:hypothetical protein
MKLLFRSPDLSFKEFLKTTKSVATFFGPLANLLNSLSETSEKEKITLEDISLIENFANNFTDYLEESRNYKRLI